MKKYTPAGIKKLRESLSMDQQEFAEHITYSREHVSRLENGKATITKSLNSLLNKLFLK